MSSPDGNKESEEETMHFEKRTCVRFVPTSEDPTSCGCGRREGGHDPGIARSEPGSDTKWDVEHHTKREPTDAFGELKFTGACRTSRAKYIRMAENTDLQNVIRLMFNKWELNKPKLLISVTGGADYFHLHSKPKQMLRQLLLKAAQSTSAWIITGGTHTGVMRHVGEAVAGHAVMSRGTQFKGQSKLHLIGIVTWGFVKDKEVLVNDKNTAQYPMNPSTSPKSSCLDNNHSNFIFVDDGTEGKHGAEIKFRASLEKVISNEKIIIAGQPKSAVPAVLLVLNGGPNTIKTVVESVNGDPAVPVVIAEGSGRAADILAFAHHITKENKREPQDDERRQILLKIKNTRSPPLSDDECSKLYKDMIKCVGKQQYITIFKMDNEDGIDVDKAILKAILKAKHTKPTEQLSLALIWDRVDIVKSVIFTEDQKWEEGDLENAMMDALLNNRVDFVKFLLEHGVKETSFLTEKRLADLYRKKVRDSFFIEHIIADGRADDDRSILRGVKRAVGRMLGGNYKIQIQGGLPAAATGNDSPFNELLVWAVLCNMQSMALFMWESGDENLAKALVAAKLYKGVAKKIEHDKGVDVRVLDELKSHMREFQSMAVDLLDECDKTNQVLSHLLLTYNLEQWASQTCMSLAVATEHEKFLAHACCQRLLSDAWTGAIKMQNFRSLKVIASLVFPPSMFFLHFKNREELLSMPVASEDHERKQESNEESSNNVELRSTSPLINSGREASSSSAGGTPIEWRKKLVEFYSAPITKFWANLIAYMAFLALFSYVVLVKQENIPDIPEILVIVFVCTLLTEEIRQILHSEPAGFKNKLKTWASSNWNLLDGFAVALFLLGVGLRMSDSTVRAGHVIYCFDLSLWIIRLLDIFSFSTLIGLHVEMIGRMIVDVAHVLLIMVTFMFAYGIAQQAILHRQQEASVSLLSQIFLKPYFQIYGEFFIDDPEKTDDNTTIFGTEAYDPFGETLVAFLMVSYLLVANILLVNLLIAIFNDTYSRKDLMQNSKYRRYSLVMEYEQRPILVPPFIILNHVAMLMNGIYRKLRCDPSPRPKSRLRLFLEEDDLHDLILFEEQCLDTYLKNSRLNVSWKERTDTILTQLQELSKVKDRLVTDGGATSQAKPSPSLVV